MARKQKVAKSIVHAILRGDNQEVRSLVSRFIGAIIAFFTLYELDLIRFKDEWFERLRTRKWQIKEEEYEGSFKENDALNPKGDMGFSGSTFFTTANGAYLIKSVPRQFEHSFFRDDLLELYVDPMEQNPKSLLIRITDFLACTHASIGGALGLAPTHHIIMENILAGQDEADGPGWETYDLKPTSYFYPERDIAGGMLTSDDTKARLADKFEDKLALTQSQADEFLGQLEQDTKLLELSNAVDYSLLLVRIPLSPSEDPFSDDNQEDGIQATEQPPFVPPEPPSFRTGIKSSDGKFVYRAAVLDFFWAKHKVHARAMTLLIKAWNLIDRQGPMSITTTPDEYRTRFLDMCRNIVKVEGEAMQV